MEGIGQYLFSITAAAIICAIAVKLIHKGVVGSVVRLIAGVFVALTVISPLIRIRLDDLEDLTGDIRLEAEAVAALGENSSREAIGSIISERTAAYILDKADALKVSVEVAVRLSADDLPIPEGVTLTGSASPYARQALTAYISQELGIDSEEIIWTP